MVLTERRYTADEWLDLPDDGHRYELADGELVELPPRTLDHGEVHKGLASLLMRAEDAGQGEYFGPTQAIILDPRGARRNARMPDLLFVRADRLHLLTGTAFEGAPDLVIEVLDDGARGDEVPGGRKFADYERFGVPHYWVVDPAARTIDQYAWRDGHYGAPAVLGGNDPLVIPLVPTIALPAGTVFAKVRQPAGQSAAGALAGPPPRGGRPASRSPRS